MPKKRPSCPKCHGNKTVPIVYGMPSAETWEESKAGRFALGGCVIGAESPKWHCLVCGHEWGKHLLTPNDLELPSSDPIKPVKLEFEIGGFDMPARYYVWLEDDTLKYGMGYGAEILELKAAAVPTARKWSNFREKLDAIGVWQWKKHYDNPTILDGVQWELAIDYGGKKIKADGSNYYPGSTGCADFRETAEFKAFLHALELLLGGVKIA